MQVVNEAISCVEEPPFLLVNYTTSSGNSSALLINIENCTSLRTNGDSNTNTSCMCHVTDDDSCLDERAYEVKVAYQSIVDSKTHVSGYSEALSLQAPSEGEIDCVCVCACACACVNIA